MRDFAPARLLLIPLLLSPLMAAVSMRDATAADAEAPRPQYVAGEKWIFSRNAKRDEMEFLGYEGPGFVMRRASADGPVVLRRYSVDGNPVSDADETGKVLWEHRGEYALFRFPLRVGKQWDELYHSRGSVARRMQVWVTAYEQVKVPAGTFWAFKLEAINQRLDRPRPAREVYWYAPEVKNIVKYSSAEFETEMELLEYLPKRPGS